MKSDNIRYLPGVDHLRGFAALLIVFYHGVLMVSYELRFGKPFASDHWLVAHQNPFAALVYEGHTAVALFMTLSGFIFTYGAFGRRIRYGSFLRNRLLRIYPLFVVIILVGSAAYPKQVTFPALMHTVTGFSNFLGSSLRLGSFSGMFWTIGIEWQFYLVFPFLLIFFERLGVRWVVGLVLLATVGRMLVFAETGNARDPSYWSLLGRIDQFVLGMLVARIYLSSRERRWPRRLFVPAVIVTLLVVALFNQLGGWPSNGAARIFWPTIEGACWAAVLLGYLCLAGNSENAASRWAARLGTISYSIYLWHFVVVQNAVRHGVHLDVSGSPVTDAFATTALVIVPATLLLATLSYAVIEAPFLGLRGTYLDRTSEAKPAS